jgi:hypothetical protein
MFSTLLTLVLVVGLRGGQSGQAVNQQRFEAPFSGAPTDDGAKKNGPWIAPRAAF